MKITNKWSIKHKILLPSIGGASVIGLSLFIYFMYSIYGIQNQNLDNIAKRTVGILTNALEYPVMSGNTDDVIGLVDWLMTQPEIESITVYAGSTVLLHREKNDSAQERYLNTYTESIVTRPTAPLSPSDEYYEAPPPAPKVIGKLTVVVSDKQAEDSFIGEAVVAFFVFTPFFVAVFAISLLSISSTDADISKILTAIRSYRDGDMEARIELDQVNDVGQIGYQFNVMAEAIQDKEKSLIEASMLQNRFMSTMSHDLRSPLGIIVANLELVISRTDLPASVRMDLNHAMNASKQLLKLIDDLISVNRIAKKGETLSLANVDLNDVVQSSVEILRPTAQHKGLTLTYKAPVEAQNMLVSADESKLIRILNNLISNALKFTEEGSVHVKLGLEHQDTHTVLARIVVQDTGIGIPESEFTNIFKPFKRLDNINTAMASGSGLGLSIVSEYVKLMGGEVTIHSQLKLGTSFEITIPFVLVKTTDVSEKNQNNVTVLKQRTQSTTILFVDDNEQYHKIINRHFEHVNITSCYNGSNALAAFKENRFDLVILDCHMPIMDGFSVAIQMRNIEERMSLARTPIIALTANAVPETEEQSKRSGMDDYLTKPFTQAEIYARVSYWLDNKKRQETSNPSQ